MAGDGPPGLVMEPVDGAQDVVLPQPDGPTSAVTRRVGEVESDVADHQVVAEADTFTSSATPRRSCAAGALAARPARPHPGSVSCDGDPVRSRAFGGQPAARAPGRSDAGIVTCQRAFRFRWAATNRAATLRMRTRTRSTRAVAHAVCWAPGTDVAFS